MKRAEEQCVHIGADWQPTPENINALPDPLRKYIANLETNADPAGIVRENTLLNDTVSALETMLIDERNEHERSRVCIAACAGMNTLREALYWRLLGISDRLTELAFSRKRGLRTRTSLIATSNGIDRVASVVMTKEAMAENNLYVEIHRPSYYPASWPCGRPTHYVVGRKPKTDDPVIDEIKGAWKAYHLDGSPFVKDDPATVCESCGGGYWPWADNFELVEEKDWPEWYRKLREAECADSQDDRAAR